MSGPSTTRLQVSGYRFLARRMRHALVRGDVAMHDDPLRAQDISLGAGVVLAAVGVVICVVLALVRPAGALGDARLVVVRDSGALYVTVDGVLHPVTDLASARLITGVTDAPRVVSQRAVDAAPRRGPRIGIVGAPQRLSPTLTAQEATWTVCEEPSGATTVIVGGLGAGVSTGRAALVTSRAAGPATTYLLYGRWRARVDLRHPAVVRALRIDGAIPRPVSDALLAAVPEAPAIEAPRIDGRGAPGPGRLHDHAIGTVMASTRAGGATERYVVLRGGVARIGEVAADLIRFTDARAGGEVPVVAPEVIASVPVVDTDVLAGYPDHGGVDDHAVLCARWDRGTLGGTASHSELLTGDALPAAAPVTALARADGDGPAVDAVSIPAGRSVLARAEPLTGDGSPAAPVFFVDDCGVRYGIGDESIAARLGLSGPPVPAPWPVLAELPGGPELSTRAALVVRDGPGPP